MPWFAFDEAFGKHYRPLGRPAKPTRLRAALSETHVRPDEVVEQWVENPYWQYFCGFDFFQHRLPIDSGTMTRWRKRVGPAGMETVLSATVGVAVDAGAVKDSSWTPVLTWRDERFCDSMFFYAFLRERDMERRGFFSLSEHLDRISKDGDPLEVLEATFDYFRGWLVEGLGYGDGAKGGRPPFDPVSMFKAMILQAQHNLSDKKWNS